MATDGKVNQFESILNNLKSIKDDSLMRPNHLGNYAAFVEAVSFFRNKCDELFRYARFVHDNPLSEVISIINSLVAELQVFARSSDVDYTNNQARVFNLVSSFPEEILKHTPAFTAAAVERLGLLELGSSREELIQLEESLKTFSSNVKSDLAKFNNEINTKLEGTAQEIIKNADDEAKRIVSHAHETARKISVKAAQEQFSNAQKSIRWKIGAWAILSFALTIGFIVVAIYYSSHHPEVPDDKPWQLIYGTAIRLTILTAIAAVGAFCLKILRSQLYLGEVNLHRIRVANSVSALVEAAFTDEKRDEILMKLVEVVTDFKDPGLVSKEGTDGVSVPMVAIDAISKTIKKD